MPVTTGRDVAAVEKETIRMSGRGQVTIPKAFVESLKLNKGELLEARIEDGRIVLEPVVAVPKHQAWYWTEAWQTGEREADEDKEAGRTTGPLTLEDAQAHLDRLMRGDD